MNHPLNLTDIKLELDDVNSKLANISAKEVLFIVFLSIIAIISLISLILIVLERRKKSQQNTVPQAIVIQPNGGTGGGGSGDKKSKSEKSKISAHSEKDVFPSRSMKVKIAIAPGQQSTRKAQSREILGEDISNVRLPKLDNVATQNLGAFKKDADSSSECNNFNGAPQPPPLAQQSLSQQPSFTDQQRAERADSLPNVTTPPPLPPQPNPPATNAAANSKMSASTDSMTSFTVPEDGRSNTSQPNSAHIVPGGQAPSTPSATTLSGNPAEKSNESTSTTVSKNTAIEPNVATPPMPGPPLLAPSNADPKDPKKVFQSLFPKGSGTMV